MSRGWDLDSGSSGGGSKKNFTKFPVGTTHIRVVDKAPHIRWTHWMNEHRKSVTCPGMKVCPIDEIISRQKANGEKETYTRSRKYAMNIYNYETEQVEIMEQGKLFMEDLKIVMEDAKDAGKELSDLKLKVRRQGTDKDNTKYRIDVAGDADEELPTEGVTDLEEYFTPHTPEQITRLVAGEKWEDVMSGNSDNDEKVQVK